MSHGAVPLSLGSRYTRLSQGIVKDVPITADYTGYRLVWQVSGASWQQTEAKAASQMKSSATRRTNGFGYTPCGDVSDH